MENPLSIVLSIIRMHAIVQGGMQELIDVIDNDLIEESKTSQVKSPLLIENS